MAENELKEKEAVFDSSGREEDLIQLNHCQGAYFKALSDEELFWKQKARVRWSELSILYEMRENST